MGGGSADVFPNSKASSRRRIKERRTRKRNVSSWILPSRQPRKVTDVRKQGLVLLRLPCPSLFQHSPENRTDTTSRLGRAAAISRGCAVWTRVIPLLHCRPRARVEGMTKTDDANSKQRLKLSAYNYLSEFSFPPSR